MFTIPNTKAVILGGAGVLIALFFLLFRNQTSSDAESRLPENTSPNRYREKNYETKENSIGNPPNFPTQTRLASPKKGNKPGMQPEDFPVKEFVYKASPEQAENEARSNPSGNREDPKSGHRAPRRKRATGDLTPEDAKKLNFLWENLSPETLKEIEDLTPREILSKYSGYLFRNKTWKVAPAEINRARERIKSKKWHVREQGTIPPEYRSNKQTCTWALSCLPQIYSYAIGTIKGKKVGPPDVCIEDNDFFYTWLKEQPEKGEMIEKKTFKVYSWTFNEIEGPSENDSRSR